MPFQDCLTVLEKEKDYYCQVLGEAGKEPSEVDHFSRLENADP